eukprot:GEMP01014945.1.p1 GENE.GEMP01014945.1~~GEMP01014945.1.p1  ORF type:complete len:306 (+),score=74.73 GEMP01014945.1:1226-2143(+)
MMWLFWRIAWAHASLAHTQRPCGADEIPFGSECEARTAVADEAKQFIIRSMPKADHDSNLQGQILNITVHFALKAKQEFPWAWEVTKGDFFRFVLPYGETNEPRTNWRELFWASLTPFVPSTATTSTKDVIAWLNGDAKFLWQRAFHQKITFQPDRTPEVFDPMSVIMFGGASCTGVSTFFLFALRTLGIPARVAGTPAWNGDDEGTSNNHSWVEILVNGTWYFTEGKPAGPADTLENPCDKWFCTPDKMRNTTVYSSQWNSTLRIPLSWAPLYPAARGVDRSVFYRSTCYQCKSLRVPQTVVKK